LFSGFTKDSTVPLGNLANASLVGANTVNGPALLRVYTNPAAFTAATKVVWSAEFTALSTISLVAYMAAPPTVTGFCAIEAFKTNADIIIKAIFFIIPFLK